MARTKLSARPQGKTLPHRNPTKNAPQPGTGGSAVFIPPPMAQPPALVGNPPSINLLAPMAQQPVDTDLPVTFNFVYSNPSIFHNSLHQASPGSIVGELRELLLNIHGPLMIHSLLNEEAYHGALYKGPQRQMLLDLCACLGIFTSEEHYKTEYWQSIPSMATPTHNNGFCSKVTGTTCTVWLIEIRREFIKHMPTPDDIQWVESHNMMMEERQQKSEQAEKIFAAVSSMSDSQHELPPTLPDLDDDKMDVDDNDSSEEDFGWLDEHKKAPQEAEIFED